MELKSGFTLRDFLGEKIVLAEGIENINFNKMLSLNDSAAYLKNWLSSLQQSPDFLKTVLNDVKKASSLINQRLEAIQLEMDKGEKADFSQFGLKGLYAQVDGHLDGYNYYEVSKTQTFKVWQYTLNPDGTVSYESFKTPTSLSTSTSVTSGTSIFCCSSKSIFVSSSKNSLCFGLSKSISICLQSLCKTVFLYISAG